MNEINYWIGVASRDHVLKGVEGGIAQLCHGDSSPLKRMKSGDWIIYYSSKH
ncbi:EVE domain-containing protein [Bacillus cereus group sp. BfR-BA-01380]|uniref:EVE domain-containing protein n=1 Tax=Bacillus cereus group sp. BfR-BA-01380 TaxID=2920324 RepID=UPI0028BED68B|nr:EVE domain-containing protein [Bacillus cereus group sp. BfR-BA-01380]